MKEYKKGNVEISDLRGKAMEGALVDFQLLRRSGRLGTASLTMREEELLDLRDLINQVLETPMTSHKQRL